MNYFVYKCNASQTTYGRDNGDWNFVFGNGAIEEKRIANWGTVEDLKGLELAQVNDIIFALQTGSRQELIGIARVAGFTSTGPRRRIRLVPLERVGKKLKRLKENYPEIASIPCLQPGPVATLYPISSGDANKLLMAARGKGRDTISAIEPRQDLETIVEAQTDPRIYEEVLRRVRAHQSQFRSNLLAVYDSKCAVTGVGVATVLEAAHISPHAESGDNLVENGILLRSDLHVLFDQGLLRINPDTFEVYFDESIRQNDPHYAGLHGQILREGRGGQRPNKLALLERWRQK